MSMVLNKSARYVDGVSARIQESASLRREPSAAMGCAFKTISIWPFFQAIRGASIVVSGGGYNSVNEARAAGIPFCGIPRKRLYDRQHKRISSNDCVERFEDLRTQIENNILNVSMQSSGGVAFRNGVQEAVNAIQVVMA